SPSQRCRDAAKKSQLDVLFENDACLPDDDDDTNGDGGDKGDDGKTDPPPTEKERIRAQCDADCATDFAAAECNDRDYAEPHWIEACSNICVEEATDWASLAHASNPAACKDGQLKGSECQQEVACLGSEDVSERCETFFEHEIDDLVSACLPD